MTATETKLRRGTESQCEAMTPVEGEVVVDLTNDRLRLGDGLTAGGIIIPNAFDMQKGSFNTANVSGTNTLTMSFDPVLPGYTNGMEINFKVANTNSGAVTIEIDGLGAKDIYKVSGGALVPLIAGDIVAGAYYNARYDGTRFVLVGAGGGVNQVTGTEGVVVTPTSGAPVVTLDTNNALGVGAVAFLLYQSGTALPSGNTTSGANLVPLCFTKSSVWGNWGYSIGSSLSGTWRNISGMSLQGSSVNVGMFQRTA